MKEIALIISVLLTLQTPPAPATQQAGRCRIEGLVVKAGTGEPLANAQLTLARAMPSGESLAIGSSPPIPPSPLPSVNTDSQGRFVFTDIAPGDYRITAAHNGYARQEYGQRLFGAQGTVVHLIAAQVIKDVVFSLTPAGTVSGQIHDASGEPVAGAQVQLLRTTYNPNAQRVFQVAGTARTNDRGEYRLYWITPGRYVLTAMTSNRFPGMFAGGGSPNEVTERRYPTTYYPGTVEESRATVIEVQPGVELNAIDMTLPSQQLYRVRGRLIGGETGQAPRNANVSLIPRQSMTPQGPFTPFRPNYDATNGTFDLRDIPPGSYWIRATVSDLAAPLPEGLAGRPINEVLSATFASNLAAQVEVDVTGSDIEGLVLTLSRGISIPGRLNVEGQALSSLDGFDRIRVTLRPTLRGVPAGRQPLQRIGPDGAYTVDNVFAGEYRVSVAPLPSGVYVKEARLGSADVLSQPLALTGPNSDSLEIVLSPKAAQITGTVLDSRSQPVPGIQAVLIPARAQRIDLYRTAITDQAGRFIMQGIPPGDYRVLAWEAIEPFAYFDPDFMRPFDQKGKSVHLGESSSETVEVSLISMVKAPATTN